METTSLAFIFTSRRESVRTTAKSLAFSSAEIESETFHFKRISPEILGKIPMMVFSKVDFPLPLAPSKQMSSPEFSVKDTSLSIGQEPYPTVTCFSVM